jgi:hypothetical protein
MLLTTLPVMGAVNGAQTKGGCCFPDAQIHAWPKRWTRIDVGEETTDFYRSIFIGCARRYALALRSKYNFGSRKTMRIEGRQHKILRNSEDSECMGKNDRIGMTLNEREDTGANPEAH